MLFANLAVSAAAATEVLACRCLEENVYIASLADKFLRLLLQLLARYGTWIKLGAQPSPPDAANETVSSYDVHNTHLSRHSVQKCIIYVAQHLGLGLDLFYHSSNVYISVFGSGLYIPSFPACLICSPASTLEMSNEEVNPKGDQLSRTLKMSNELETVAPNTNRFPHEAGLPGSLGQRIGKN